MSGGGRDQFCQVLRPRTHVVCDAFNVNWLWQWCRGDPILSLPFVSWGNHANDREDMERVKFTKAKRAAKPCHAMPTRFKVLAGNLTC